jgi:hypothetical protein
MQLFALNVCLNEFWTHLKYTRCATFSLELLSVISRFRSHP